MSSPLLGTRPASPGCVPPSFVDLGLDRLLTLLEPRDDDPDGVRAAMVHPPTRGDVRIRQAVFADLADPANREFASALDTLLAGVVGDGRRRGRDQLQVQRMLLGAAARYCAGVVDLAARVDGLAVRSDGMRAVCAAVTDLAASARFQTLREAASHVVDALAGVRYCILVRGNRITVAPFAGEVDVLDELDELDALTGGGHPAEGAPGRSDRHVGGDSWIADAVLDRAALIFPGPFGALGDFAAAHGDFVDPGLAALARDLRFFLRFDDLVRPLAARGLTTCLPAFEDDRTTTVGDGYDLVLALTAPPGTTVVTNGLHLDAGDHVAVVTGPNQGGKTTFARMLGQVHVLASRGVPVPGSQVAVSHTGQVLTHFERAEPLQDLASRFEDDVRRIADIIAAAGPADVVVLNELFSSTTAVDAVDLTRDVVRRLRRRDPLIVCVTFLDELAADPDTVSLVAGVAADTGDRTFEVERRAADGRAYAEALAARHGIGRAVVAAGIRR